MWIGCGALTGVNHLISAVRGMQGKGSQETLPLLPQGDQVELHQSQQARPAASSSSMRKSTSSMTLPVSSPSSHSQFDDVATLQRQAEPVIYPVGGVAVTDSQPNNLQASPQDVNMVEQRLEDLTRHLACLEQKMCSDIAMILDILRFQQTPSSIQQQHNHEHVSPSPSAEAAKLPTTPSSPCIPSLSQDSFMRSYHGGASPKLPQKCISQPSCDSEMHAQDVTAVLSGSKTKGPPEDSGGMESCANLPEAQPEEVHFSQTQPLSPTNMQYPDLSRGTEFQNASL